MNIPITLNAEQESALAGLVADYNAGRDTPVDATTYLATVLTGVIDDRVARNFEATASALVTAAKSMSYEARLDLIATVQSKLA